MLRTFALCLLWGYHSAGGKEGTQPWDECQDTAWLDLPALRGSGSREGPQLHPHPQGRGSSSRQRHMPPALPTAPLHLGLSVPSFTTCFGLSSAPAQEAAPAPLQVTAALPSGALGSRWATGPCSDPAVPRASPSLRVCGTGGICRTRSCQPPPPSPLWVSGDVWEQSQTKSCSSTPLGKSGDPSTRRP